MGQYLPGDSVVHSADPRAKVVLAMVFLGALFAVETWTGFAVASAVILALIVNSRVPVRMVARGLRPVFTIMLITLCLNALAWGDPESVRLVGSVGFSAEGARRGLFLVIRIMVLMVGTSLVTFTTSPVALTDAVSSLMRPLNAFRFPVDDVAMMFSIALRFIPTTAEEADRIVIAQTARGARFDQGGVVRRAGAWLPVLVPLFVRLFRRADDLAIAMESRCYTGRGRTRLRELRLTGGDVTILVVGVCGSVLLAVLF